MLQVPVSNSSKPVCVGVDFVGHQLHRSLVEVRNSKKELLLRKEIDSALNIKEVQLPDLNEDNSHYIVQISCVVANYNYPGNDINTYSVEILFTQGRQVIVQEKIMGQFEESKTVSVVALYAMVYCA